MATKKRQLVIPSEKDVPVFDPETNAYMDPVKGAGVVWRPYWKRRLKEGVITLGEGPVLKKMEERAAKEKEFKAKQKKEKKKGGKE